VALAQNDSLRTQCPVHRCYSGLRYGALQVQFEMAKQSICLLGQGNVQPLVEVHNVQAGLLSEHGSDGGVQWCKILVTQTVAVQQYHTQQHLHQPQTQSLEDQLPEASASVQVIRAPFVAAAVSPVREAAFLVGAAAPPSPMSRMKWWL
jgi:hypothetical protein